MTDWNLHRLREHFEDSSDPALIKRFAAYHAQNLGVYAEFLQRALAVRRTGRRHYSAWTIIQAIRWDFDMRTTGDVFKINNDHIAFYARMAMVDQPSLLEGFFELRRMKPEGRRISGAEKQRSDE